MAWLNASAMRASAPDQCVGRRTEKSPSRNASIAVSSSSERASALSCACPRVEPLVTAPPWIGGGARRDFFRGRVRVAVSLIVGFCKLGGIDETSRQNVGRSYDSPKLTGACNLELAHPLYSMS